MTRRCTPFPIRRGLAHLLYWPPEKWQISAIDSDEAKIARERYVPTFKSKDSPLTVPEIDNSFYETLKEYKKSQASKTNIEPEEKPWHQLHFKIADLGKPLLYLTRQAITGDLSGGPFI